MSDIAGQVEEIVSNRLERYLVERPAIARKIVQKVVLSKDAPRAAAHRL